MSEREPTIADVLAAVKSVDGKVDTLRINVMDRIDRVQDTVTKTDRDMQALLELMTVNQRYAETGVSAMKSVGELSTVVTKLVQDIRRLDAEVQELKNRR